MRAPAPERVVEAQRVRRVNRRREVGRHTQHAAETPRADDLSSVAGQRVVPVVKGLHQHRARVSCDLSRLLGPQRLS